MTQKKTIDDVLNCWFSDSTKALWFNSTTEFDQRLKNEFSELCAAAKNGEVDSWQDTPRGAIALVILLDQIPLNIFRNSAERYSTEKKARLVANYIIDKEEDIHLTDEYKMFLYMPFMHSENIEDQNRSVELFEREGMAENLKFAKHHRDIIRKYGRFPHRNKELNRQNTEQETAYLQSDEAFLG